MTICNKKSVLMNSSTIVLSSVFNLVNMALCHAVFYAHHIALQLSKMGHTHLIYYCQVKLNPTCVKQLDKTKYFGGSHLCQNEIPLSV